ncbi:MAG: hypothetical protein Ct9H300mP32_5580 [Verrucomicrobiota bacterium]|nr:MAG: hypothetical protein Ct9H300mP32_5580 [Verrucomicrobiota bacterium]
MNPVTCFILFCMFKVAFGPKAQGAESGSDQFSGSDFQALVRKADPLDQWKA